MELSRDFIARLTGSNRNYGVFIDRELQSVVRNAQNEIILPRGLNQVPDESTIGLQVPLSSIAVERFLVPVVNGSSGGEGIEDVHIVTGPLYGLFREVIAKLNAT